MLALYRPKTSPEPNFALMNHQSDIIYNAFISGDMELFYKLQYPGLILYACKLLDPEVSCLAEDCVQDVIVNTYLHKDDIHAPFQLRSYLLNGVRNRVIDVHRQYTARTRYVDSKSWDAGCFKVDDYSATMIENEVLDRLYAAVRMLPPIYREVFDMSFAEGLKISEIAERLGIADITVKKRKAKLIEILRGHFSDLSHDQFSILLAIVLCSN